MYVYIYIYTHTHIWRPPTCAILSTETARTPALYGFGSIGILSFVFVLSLFFNIFIVIISGRYSSSFCFFLICIFTAEGAKAPKHTQIPRESSHALRAGLRVRNLKRQQHIGGVVHCLSTSSAADTAGHWVATSPNITQQESRPEGSQFARC